jgi:hypothetical protein
MWAMGRVVRTTVIRAGKTWRIPIGLRRGLRVEVDSHAPLHVYLGTAELEITPYIRQFVQAGSRCFDIGGYDGCDALALARLTGSEVISFEFDERSVARMQRNLALNPNLARNVRIFQTYVAHERTATPRTDTLDSLIETGDVFEPDFLKIDVEGAEAAVLSGARNLLKNRQPHVVVETHSGLVEEQCIALLQETGYSPVIVDRRTWLREKRGRGQNRWLTAPGRDA